MLSRSNKRIQEALAKVTELNHEVPTHFNVRLQRTSRIDRCFIGSPSWLAVRTKLNVSVLASPLSFHKQGLSDHAPLVMKAGYPATLPPTALPIPSYVTRNPQFKVFVRRLEQGVNWNALPVLDQHDRYLCIVREAARMVRDSTILGSHEGDTLDRDALLVGTIARCVARNNVGLSKRLCRISTQFASHVQILHGLVSLICPIAFETFVDNTMLCMNNRHIAQIRGKDAGRGRMRHRLRRYQDRLRAWVPWGKSIALVGVLCDGVCISGKEEMEAALDRHWGAVFALPQTYQTDQLNIMQNYSPIDLSLCPMPSFV